MVSDTTSITLKESVNQLAQELDLALSQHDLGYLQKVADEIHAELYRLLDDRNLSQLDWLSGYVQKQFKSYLRSPDAQREPGLWMVPQVSLSYKDIVSIQDNELAAALAVHKASDHGIAAAQYFLEAFAQQRRHECTQDLLSERLLTHEFLAAPPSLQMSLVTELVGVMAMYHSQGKPWPEHWSAFVQGIEPNHPDWKMPAWEGANLAIMLKKLGLNLWLESNMGEIVNSPRVGDLDHFMALSTLGFKFKGLERKNLFLNCFIRLSMAAEDDQGHDSTLIEALMVYDFYQSGDYAHTTCTKDNQMLDRMKAHVASHIWKTSDECTRVALLEVLNLEFCEQSMARKVKKHFDVDLYRHLDVGGVDALEDDLGL